VPGAPLPDHPAMALVPRQSSGKFLAERAEDKRMTTYVYDYPSGSTASFHIDGEYVFPMSGTQPAFWINGDYWYHNPSNWHASILGKRQVRL